jgi:hypothetical protein
LEQIQMRLTKQVQNMVIFEETLFQFCKSKLISFIDGMIISLII